MVYSFKNGKSGEFAGVFMCHELPFVRLRQADGLIKGSISLKEAMAVSGLSQAQIEATAPSKKATAAPLAPKSVVINKKAKEAAPAALKEVAKVMAADNSGFTQGWVAAADFLLSHGWNKSGTYLMENVGK